MKNLSNLTAAALLFLATSCDMNTRQGTNESVANVIRTTTKVPVTPRANPDTTTKGTKSKAFEIVDANGNMVVDKGADNEYVVQTPVKENIVLNQLMMRVSVPIKHGRQALHTKYISHHDTIVDPDCPSKLKAIPVYATKFNRYVENGVDTRYLELKNDYVLTVILGSGAEADTVNVYPRVEEVIYTENNGKKGVVMKLEFTLNGQVFNVTMSDDIGEAELKGKTAILNFTGGGVSIKNNVYALDTKNPTNRVITDGQESEFELQAPAKPKKEKKEKFNSAEEIQ